MSPSMPLDTEISIIDVKCASSFHIQLDALENSTANDFAQARSRIVTATDAASHHLHLSTFRAELTCAIVILPY
jgi:hypothetical protein